MKTSSPATACRGRFPGSFPPNRRTMNALRRFHVFLIIVVASFFCVASAHALPILMHQELTPSHPTSADFIVERIAGWFPTSGYSIPDPPEVVITGDDIFVDIFAISREGVVLPVLIPFT